MYDKNGIKFDKATHKKFVLRSESGFDICEVDGTRKYGNDVVLFYSDNNGDIQNAMLSQVALIEEGYNDVA